MSLPGVAELLRPTGPGPASDSGRQASGREAHPQKITVYLSADEFLDLERARLALRARGIGVDRGRLVREAIAVLLADLESGIDASVIARRLLAAAEQEPAGHDAQNGAASQAPGPSRGGSPSQNSSSGQARAFTQASIPSQAGAPGLSSAPSRNGAARQEAGAPAEPQ